MTGCCTDGIADLWSLSVYDSEVDFFYRRYLFRPSQYPFGSYFMRSICLEKPLQPEFRIPPALGQIVHQKSHDDHDYRAHPHGNHSVEIPQGVNF